MTVKLEICVDTLESAISAEKGGADSIELCDNLFDGGTTPSCGTLELAKERLGIDVHAIIRPRGGDFLYSDAELQIMRRDIVLAKEIGLDGVVFGVLTKDGAIDINITSELIDLAYPLSCTFHRAFDVCRNPLEDLERLIELRIKRVLTSGQAPTAIAGIEQLESFKSLAGNRTCILACGNLDEKNVAEVIQKTGVDYVHMTAFETVQSEMAYQNPHVGMGSPDRRQEYVRNVVSESFVRRISNIVRAN